MNKTLRRLLRTATCICALSAVLTGCGQTENNTAKEDDKLTVYLWDRELLTSFTPYLHEQFPDSNIEVIAGCNDTALYSYLNEHGELPDIITVRRYSGTDAKDLEPYLMDFGAYDVVSEYSSYTLQYYKSENGEINWLPICGIPQTIIANKSMFDRYGLELPTNYGEYAAVCQAFYNNGIKPYAIDLANDWSAHEIIQAGGIGEFTSLEGIKWRSGAESAKEDIAFDDVMWEQIFKDTVSFLNDSHFTDEDLSISTEEGMALFTNEQAAMFHGSPQHLKLLQEQMDAELVRIPYFAQASDEGYIYMTPSLNVALNKELENNPDKLAAAIKLLECMISDEGQKLIANGDSVLSFNPEVASVTDGMEGLEEQLENNEYYIRYSAQKSFSASYEAVKGLLTGSMDEQQAYDAFRDIMNSRDDAKESVVNFENEYALSLNDKNGRDAASVILTTVREKEDAQLAFAPYHSFSSSIYKGECSEKSLQMMIAYTPGIYLVKLSGAKVKAMVQEYLDGADNNFRPYDSSELPIASGMKLVINNDTKGYTLKDILVNGESIADSEEYTVMVIGEAYRALQKAEPGQGFEPIDGKNFASAWAEAAMNRQIAAEPEDYIELAG